MVEGSPPRVSVASHEGCIKKSLSEDDEKPRSPLPPEKKQMLRKIESAPPQSSPSASGASRWKKLRTTVQIGSAMSAHYKKPPLKREDSFLQRFSTRPTSTPVDVDQPAKNFHFNTVLNPDESLLFWWLWIVVLCGLHNSWTLIVRQAFPELQHDLDTLWKVVDGCCDGVYLLDIVVQFRTGYLEQGIMVRDGVRLARHYLASKDFFLDVATLTPLDFLQGVVGESPLLRFPRFLKARRIYKFYYAVESRTAYPNLWRVANLIHVLLLLAHWFGCFYYMLSELEGFQGSWAYRHPEREESPLVRKYLGSVYWSTLTLTTIGDLATPATNLQYLFTIISYLIGVFIFATIVGQVGNVITNRNASRLEFERLLDGAKMYMRHHKVPKGMQRRVQRWYDYSWSRGRMQGGGDIHSALGILPDKLKTELAIHVNLKTLKKVSIFQECQPEFLHDLVLKMRAYIFTPGDLVCRKGEVAREMFIIADGILEVINEKGQVLTQMKAGDFFGEIGILNLDGFNRRTADVRSVGYSELFSLSREDVLSAMKDYPDAEEILQTMGRKRLMDARRSNNPEPVDTKSSALQSEDQRQEHILDIKVKEDVFVGSDTTSKLLDDTDFESDTIQSETESCVSFTGSADNRQRKIGLAISQLLKSKRESENVAHSEQKSSNVSCISEGMKKSGSREHPFSELVSKFAHVRQKASDDNKMLSKTEESPAVSSLIDRFMQKQGKMSQMPQMAANKKRSLWHKLARFVHLRHWRTCNLEPVLDISEPKVNYCSAKQTDIQSFQISKRITSPVENRRTSWHPSKPSISNWNRSELFTNSRDKLDNKCRRKTLSDAGTLLKTTLTKERSQKPLPGILMTGSGQKTLPGILMTGSGLNVKEESPDISPMSSNYSLTPSTSDDESNEEEEEEEDRTTTETALQEDTMDKPSPAKKVPEMPSSSESMEDFIKKIVCDFKTTMDSYIAETEKEMCLKIMRLEEESKKKDAEIQDLQQQVMEQLRRNSAEMAGEETNLKEKSDPDPFPILSTQNKNSEDSAICMIDITTSSPPPDTVPEIHFEDEEMWLVEFPQNVPNPFLSVKHPQLRRHSSVEVGHDVPFSLTSQKTDETLLPLPVPSGLPLPIPGGLQPPVLSPRRFSESQARPEVVLNNSFAARVRRVFAKVKANKASEEASEERASPPVAFKWPLLNTSKTRRSSCGSTGTDKHARQQQFLQLQEEAFESQTETAKTLLPTITESCSVDSLKETPMMDLKFHVPPKSPLSKSVVIDLPENIRDENT